MVFLMKINEIIVFFVIFYNIIRNVCLFYACFRADYGFDVEKWMYRGDLNVNFIGLVGIFVLWIICG